ncbi:uncharacterized protein MKK02DRAFT_41934 [Dioszegia hungarica]|uniref:YetF C-terminal domain-containing protein n=1 Tax=Dioszegia hungarica TaxID=4972 RepID=A0AA38LWL7_9TREE|nr:uncharacterized protein MKK02DRAFT_41934 [Dioszegia hungarica]KAI9638907.1 hypothetical protein MKK02DRAFT_41934 [Dioszegia hungarica]
MAKISLTPYIDEALLDLDDFLEIKSILHPVAIGSIANLSLFAYLRISSNRTVAPLTIWDEICSIALGSTLAGIINGNSLLTGLEALAVLLLWQYKTSWIGCRFPKAGVLFTKSPLVVAFRGRCLEGLMRKHRITHTDLYGAFRTAGIFAVCEVECAVVEATGVFSIYKTKDMPTDYDADVLLSIKGLQGMSKSSSSGKSSEKSKRKRSISEAERQSTEMGDASDDGRSEGSKGTKKGGHVGEAVEHVQSDEEDGSGTEGQADGQGTGNARRDKRKKKTNEDRIADEES